MAEMSLSELCWNTKLMVLLLIVGVIVGVLLIGAVTILCFKFQREIKSWWFSYNGYNLKKKNIFKNQNDLSELINPDDKS